MSRGRPRGSVKADRRLRRDYRFSRATMQLIEQGRQRTDMTETAFVEAAICHYLDFLTEKETEVGEVERLRARLQHLEQELAEASRPSRSRPASAAVQIPPAQLPPAGASMSSSATRRPTYQIYVKHAPGQCPTLPDGFAYIDLDTSIEPRQCPIHRVFAQSCTVAAVRQQVERLKTVPEISSIWPDKGGQTLARDCWRRENGHWIRDD